jgi:hypothetical protein
LFEDMSPLQTPRYDLVYCTVGGERWLALRSTNVSPSTPLNSATFHWLGTRPFDEPLAFTAVIAADVSSVVKVEADTVNAGVRKRVQGSPVLTEADLAIGLRVPGLAVCRLVAPPATLTGAASLVVAVGTLPAGLVGPNGFVDIDYSLTMTNNANNKTLSLSVGGVVVSEQAGNALDSATGHRQSVRIWANGGSEVGRQVTAANPFGNTASGATTSLSGLNFDTAQAITMTLGLENTADTVTLQALTVQTTYMP